MGDVPPLLFLADAVPRRPGPRDPARPPTGRAVAHDPGGRRLHVAGPVRVPLHGDGGGDAGRARRTGAPGAGGAHDPDRGGGLRERPTRAQARRRRARRGRAARSSASAAVATSRCSRSPCACWPPCRGRSATWSPARRGSGAGSRSRSGRRSSYRCRSRALARAGRAGGLRRRGLGLRLGGARLHRLHRRARVAGRLRASSTDCCPATRRPRWCRGSCWCRPVAIGSAWLLLGEQPTVAELAGGAVLVLGVLVALTQTGTQRTGRVDALAPGRGIHRTQSGRRSSRCSATRLGVRRSAAQVGERGSDPAGAEVGSPLVHLGERAELGGPDLARLRDDPLDEGRVVGSRRRRPGRARRPNRPTGVASR